MYDNQNYPWYVQKSPVFKTLYDGVFPIVSAASPLGLADILDIDSLEGNSLYRFGNIIGLRGNPYFFDGLIYNVDKWSDVKVWTGKGAAINEQLYRNFVKMKAFLQARASVFLQGFSLILIKEAMDIILDGQNYKLSVDEGFMEFIINIEAEAEVIRVFRILQSYDRHFLGKPSGIKYIFNYTETDAGSTQII